MCVKEEKIRIGVVILNYMAYEVTINCVKDFLDSVKQNIDMKIVVVDNFSKNNSVEKISQEFLGDKRVNIVRTDKNLGFANGNNYGYEVLRRGFDPDFTIIANDDILLPDKSLVDWILQSMDKYDFAVLGPSVYSTRGKFYQSPMENFSVDKKQCVKELIKFYKMLFAVRVKIILHMSGGKNTNKKKNDADYILATEQKTLHGSFLVFSKKYFEYYNDPFDSGTFLYMEENILRLRCNKKNLKMVYTPDYCVHHLQSVSTNMVSEDQLKRDYLRIKL